MAGIASFETSLGTKPSGPSGFPATAETLSWKIIRSVLPCPEACLAEMEHLPLEDVSSEIQLARTLAHDLFHFP